MLELLRYHMVFIWTISSWQLVLYDIMKEAKAADLELAESGGCMPT